MNTPIVKGTVSRILCKTVIEDHEFTCGMGTIKSQSKRSVRIGAEMGIVEVSVDLQELLNDLGSRALHSARGVSKLKGGVIVAKVISRKKTLDPKEEK